MYQVNFSRTGPIALKLHCHRINFSLACAFFLDGGSPDGCPLRQNCWLCHVLLCYKEWAMYLSSKWWRGVFQPISLVAPRAALWEKKLFGAFLSTAFPAGSMGISPLSCQVAWNPPQDTLPRKLCCLICHGKFLSGARCWMLMLGTAEWQTLWAEPLGLFRCKKLRRWGRL